MLIASLLAYFLFGVPRTSHMFMNYEDEVLLYVLTPLSDIPPNPHPVLIHLILKLGLSAVGFENIRWLPFLFGLGTWGLTFLWARKAFSYSVAVWALLFMSVTPWNVISSTMIEKDGAIFCFFLMLLLYSYFETLRADGPRRLGWWLCETTAFCVLIFCKFTAVIFLGGLAVHFWLHQGWRRTLREMGSIFITGMALLWAYSLITPSLGHNAGRNVLHYISSPYGLLHFNPYQALTGISRPILFAGPLLLPALASLLYPADIRSPSGLLRWLCLGYILPHLVLTDNVNAFRHWMPAIPLLCLLSAQWVKNRLDRADGEIRWLPVMLSGFIAAAGLLWLNRHGGPSIVQPIYPKIEMNWGHLWAYLPIRSGSGPAGFYLRPYLALTVFGSAALLGLWAQYRPRSWALKAFLSLGLAYALMGSADLSYEISGPRIEKVGRQAMTDFKQQNWTRPLYVTGCGSLALTRHLGLHWRQFQIPIEIYGVWPATVDELGGPNYQVYGFVSAAQEIEQAMGLMKKTGGTLLLMNVPTFSASSSLIQYLQRSAVLRNSYASRGIEMAQIWDIKPDRRTQ